MESKRIGCVSWFAILLQITFIVLKLCGVIDWAWFYVLLPCFIYGAIIIIGFFIFLAARR